MTRLGQIMKQQDMKVAELALQTYINPRTIRRHVAGTTEISLSQAQRYAEALGVSIAELIDTEPEAAQA